MPRSLKKGPFVHYSLEKKIMKNIEENKGTITVKGKSLAEFLK